MCQAPKSYDILEYLLFHLVINSKLLIYNGSVSSSIPYWNASIFLIGIRRPQPTC